MAKQTEKYSNKLWQTLRCLSSESRLRLIRFLRSPYFITSKTMLPLCEVLNRLVERGDEGFDRQQVWQKIFPGEPYKDISFRKACSDLLKLVLEFMAHEQWANDEVQLTVSTLSYIVKNKVEPLQNTTERRARAALKKKAYRSATDFASAYMLERQFYALSNFDVRLDARANLEEISFPLDCFYWIEKLKICSIALAQVRTGNYTYHIPFMEETVAFLRTYPVEQVPELAIYYYSFLSMYDESDEKNYFVFRQLLDQYATMMPQKEAIELFDSALHYCTGKINKGDRAFLQEYFNVFEEAIQKGIFLQNGELATWRYNNMVATALGLGKLEWAENFIETYKKNLPAESRENTYTFNIARVYRFQKKYDQVLELLQNVEYEDIGVNLISKMMLLITHYERNDFEVLNSFIDSFRVFLNRHKNIPQQRKAGYLNLLKYTRRLTKVRLRGKAAVTKLYEEIAAGKANIVNHEWLLEKLAAML